MSISSLLLLFWHINGFASRSSSVLRKKFETPVTWEWNAILSKDQQPVQHAAMHTVIRLCVVDNHLEAHTPPQLTNTTVLHDSMRVLDIREQTHAQGWGCNIYCLELARSWNREDAHVVLNKIWRCFVNKTILWAELEAFDSCSSHITIIRGGLEL